MYLSFDLDALADACRRLPALADIGRGDMVLLPRKGTSNDHVRLGAVGTVGGGLVARVPRFNHGGLDAPTNLAWQEAGFMRAAPSGHTPRLHDVLPIGDGLPGGVLIVDFIDGRAPRLPDDMAAIATALAALHTLPVPPLAERPPLTRATDPLTATIEAIEQHAVCLDAAGLDDVVRAALGEELHWAREFVASGTPDLPLRFVGADAHPGNFLIDAGGKAWFTDLEKAQYGAAPIDLAHASLATSTGWDPDVAGTLSHADVTAFYAAYLAHPGTTGGAPAAWLLPLRRLTWLRTMTFFARWRTDWSRNPAAGSRDATMDRHIAAHILRCFAPDSVADTRNEWLGPDVLLLPR